MKRATSISMLLLFAITTNAQLSISISEGGSMEIEGLGEFINKGSTLVREYITLNDETCPLLLNPDVGIEVEFRIRGNIRFAPTGGIFPLQPITAFEIHHVLYDPFGEYIKSLSYVEITDREKSKNIQRDGVWYTSEHEAKEYFYCVSYVANVRTAEGEIWRYDPLSIMSELNTIQISYEEEYLPPNSQDE